jgi:hypothetical protein
MTSKTSNLEDTSQKVLQDLTKTNMTVTKHESQLTGLSTSEQVQQTSPANSKLDQQINGNDEAGQCK